MLSDIFNQSAIEHFAIGQNESIEKQLVFGKLTYKVDIPAFYDDVGKWEQNHVQFWARKKCGLSSNQTDLVMQI